MRFSRLFKPTYTHNIWRKKKKKKPEEEAAEKKKHPKEKEKGDGTKSEKGDEEKGSDKKDQETPDAESVKASPDEEGKTPEEGGAGDASNIKVENEVPSEKIEVKEELKTEPQEDVESDEEEYMPVLNMGRDALPEETGEDQAVCFPFLVLFWIVFAMSKAMIKYLIYLGERKFFSPKVGL